MSDYEKLVEEAMANPLIKEAVNVHEKKRKNELIIPKVKVDMSLAIAAAIAYIKREAAIEKEERLIFIPVDSKNGSVKAGDPFSVAMEICRAFEDIFEDHALDFDHLQFRENCCK